MPHAISRDGTRITYEQSGAGEAVLLVDGALGTRSLGFWGGLPTLLAQHFSVIVYDRRGRGESGDTLPYAVAREVEDIEALIDVCDGAAALYGISSGAALALEAAVGLGEKVRAVALYEAALQRRGRRPVASLPAGARRAAGGCPPRRGGRALHEVRRRTGGAHRAAAEDAPLVGVRSLGPDARLRRAARAGQ